MQVARDDTLVFAFDGEGAEMGLGGAGSDGVAALDLFPVDFECEGEELAGVVGEGKDEIILVNLSGRGDKDLGTVMETLGELTNS